MSSSPSSSLKRSHPDDENPRTDTPTKPSIHSTASSPLSSATSSKDADDLSKLDSAGTKSTESPIPTEPSNSKPPQKRRKFTTQEKEQQRLEEEAKKKARSERKAQKDEEKRVRELAQQEKKEKHDEEKRLRDEATRAKKEQQEERKRAKELEQAKKDEEKAKKERSQLKLNAFFGTPKPTNKGTTTPSKKFPIQDEPQRNDRRKSLSIDPEGSARGSVPPSPSAKTPKPIAPKATILPFELPSNTTMIRHRSTLLSDNQRESIRQQLERDVSTGSRDEHLLKNLKAMTGSHRVVGLESHSVKKLMDFVSGTAERPIDLTLSSDGAIPNDHEPLAWLSLVPVKYLEFSEDVRPPYCGTYTKNLDDRKARLLARKSNAKELPEVNYDYDSEAEWEEPEEGEDLLSDGEEDLDSNDDGEDMDGFLDDEEVDDNRRRMVTGDLEPNCSGLFWENIQGRSQSADNSSSIDFHEYKIGFLLESPATSIDPFSTAYWATVPLIPATSFINPQVVGSMNPPRLPLSVRPDGMMNSANVPNMMSKNPILSNASGLVPQKASGLPKRMVPPDQLEQFKTAIAGSDLTKIAMIESLKKSFPTLTKEMITNTLGAIAKRVGPSQTEKKWVLV